MIPCFSQDGITVTPVRNGFIVESPRQGDAAGERHVFVEAEDLAAWIEGWAAGQIKPETETESRLAKVSRERADPPQGFLEVITRQSPHAPSMVNNK